MTDPTDRPFSLIYYDSPTDIWIPAQLTHIAGADLRNGPIPIAVYCNAGGHLGKIGCMRYIALWAETDIWGMARSMPDAIRQLGEAVLRRMQEGVSSGPMTPEQGRALEILIRNISPDDWR